MSAQHTQGKLKVFSTYAIPEIRDQDENFLFAAGSASPQSFCNARRLAACWNACESLQTDLLENITLMGDTLAGRFKARDEIERELAAQRDDLLKALKEIEWSNNSVWQSDCARAAIAKAEGQ